MSLSRRSLISGLLALPFVGGVLMKLVSEEELGVLYSPTTSTAAEWEWDIASPVDAQMVAEIDRVLETIRMTSSIPGIYLFGGHEMEVTSGTSRT